MTHTEARISNERLAERLEKVAAAADGSSAGAKAVMLEAAQALRAPIEAEPISWLSFNDNSEPYLTGNQAEMIKLEATGPGPHALYARSLSSPSPSDGEVSEAASYWRGCLADDAMPSRREAMRHAETLLNAIEALQSKRGQP